MIYPLNATNYPAYPVALNTQGQAAGYAMVTDGVPTNHAEVWTYTISSGIMTSTRHGSYAKLGVGLLATYKTYYPSLHQHLDRIGVRRNQ